MDVGYVLSLQSVNTTSRPLPGESTRTFPKGSLSTFPSGETLCCPSHAFHSLWNDFDAQSKFQTGFLTQCCQKMSSILTQFGAPRPRLIGYDFSVGSVGRDGKISRQKLLWCRRSRLKPAAPEWSKPSFLLPHLRDSNAFISSYNETKRSTLFQ